VCSLPSEHSRARGDKHLNLEDRKTGKMQRFKKRAPMFRRHRLSFPDFLPSKLKVLRTQGFARLVAFRRYLCAPYVLDRRRRRQVRRPANHQ
jgi:hypothetical protein